MSYEQLVEGGRCQISVLLGQEISVTNIARTLNCHRVTIYRELKRNKKVTE
jgi:IS30 family transposase